VGTVRARQRAVIESKVSGRIAQMPVSLGQVVAPGETLVQLDVREMEARLEQAQAEQARAQADLNRLQPLLKQGAVTPQEFDAAQSRARVAEGAVSEARTLLGYAEIRAPFRGVITKKLADMGDLATPGKPLLELEDPSSLRVEVNVPEALIGRVRAGESMPVHLPALNRTLTGTVGEVAPAADATSHTFLVKLDVPATGDLRAGMFGRVSVPVGESSELRVPKAAVVTRGQLELVFVVEKGVAHMRLVRTGGVTGSEVELLSGVAPGDVVVVEGAAGLEDGQPVTTIE